MSELICIGFDNEKRLEKNIYYFEYENVCFKLIQNNPRKWSDVLLTIIPDNDISAYHHAFEAAGKFFSSLSWNNNSSISFRYLGGSGVSSTFQLRNARCLSFSPPEIPIDRIQSSKFGISQIADINNEAQRKALYLFREALSSNKNILSFLFFWQIMDISNSSNVANWINKVYFRRPCGIRLNSDDLVNLSLGNRKIGDFLNEDFRNAIAHLKRNLGRVSLKLDDPDDTKRLAICTRIVKEFSRYYITNELKVLNKMILVRRPGHRFPIYLKQN